VAIEAAATEPGQKIRVPTTGRGIAAMDEKERWITFRADRRPVQGMDPSRFHYCAQSNATPQYGRVGQARAMAVRGLFGRA